MNRPRLSRDLLTGLLFIGIGGLGLGLGASLEAGSTGAMEAGYFPRMVSLLIAALGLLVALLGLLRPGEVLEQWHWWPLSMVTAATVAFAALLDTAGFVATLFAVALVASMAGGLLNLWRAAVLAGVLMLLNVGLFTYALGLPLRLWPRL
jgi:Tripartite tricarboxylate transporter TctB family